jgi:hypothetical protein
MHWASSNKGGDLLRFLEAAIEQKISFGGVEGMSGSRVPTKVYSYDNFIEPISGRAYDASHSLFRDSGSVGCETARGRCFGCFGVRILIRDGLN